MEQKLRGEERERGGVGQRAGHRRGRLEGGTGDGEVKQMWEESVVVGGVYCRGALWEGSIRRNGTHRHEGGVGRALDGGAVDDFLAVADEQQEVVDLLPVKSGGRHAARVARERVVGRHCASSHPNPVVVLQAAEEASMVKWKVFQHHGICWYYIW